MFVSLDLLLLWEDEADLCGNVVCRSKVVSIMIGPEDSDCRFQLLLRRMYIVYKSAKLLSLGSNLPIIIHSFKTIFQPCGEYLKVECNLILVE